MVSVYFLNNAVWGSGLMELGSGPGVGRLRCSFVRSWAFVTSSNGGVWFSVADFSKDAIGDLDRVREYRCLGSDVHIVSHSGSSKPRIRFAQQKFRVGMSSVGC